MFPDASDPEYTKYIMYATPDTYGYFETAAGRIRKRDAKGEGMLNTLMQVFTEKMFLDVSDTSEEVPLGFSYLQRALFEATADNGGGPPKCIKELRAKLPGLPDGWGLEHHLNRAYIRGLADSELLSTTRDRAVWFAQFCNTPKKEAFITETCEAWNMTYVSLSVVAPQRWARATHELFSQITNQLRVTRFVVQEFIDGFPLEEDDKREMKLLRRMLKSHKHLMALHWLTDLLHVKGCLSEKAQKGEASALDQADLLVGLPSSFSKLLDNKNCPMLRRYKGLVRTNDTGHKFIREMVIDEDESTGILTERDEEVRLADDDSDAEAQFQEECDDTVDRLIEISREEMKPADDLLAFRDLFDVRRYDWRKMRGDKTYFKGALLTLTKQYEHIFKAAGAPWVCSSQFVEYQAENLQNLFCGGNSLVDWKSEAKTKSDREFWTTVREHGARINISLVLYFRKGCLVRDGYGAAVEQFISYLNKIMDDRQRRHLSGEKAEDILRIAYNGTSVQDWDPSGAFNAWTQVFNKKLVKTVGEQNISRSKNANKNQQARERYAETAAVQARKLAQSTKRYAEKRILVSLSRGSLTEGPKKRRTTKEKPSGKKKTRQNTPKRGLGSARKGGGKKQKPSSSAWTTV
jgi:hypothetical protein